MGFLELSSGLPELSSATISVWFRIPQESIDAARAEITTSNDDPMANSVPVITFGKSGTRRDTENVGGGEVVYRSGYVRNIAQSMPIAPPEDQSGPIDCSNPSEVTGSGSVTYSDPWGPNEYQPNMGTMNLDHTTEIGDTIDIGPSFICIDCRGLTTKLVINLQTEKKPKTSGIAKDVTGITPYIFANGTGGYWDGTISWTFSSPYIGPIGPTCHGIVSYEYTPPDGNPNDASTFATWIPYTGDVDIQQYEEHYTDVSETVMNAMQAFRWDTNVSITPDHWHHLIVSFSLSDVSASASGDPKQVSSSAKVYIALDDVDYPYDSDKLGPFAPEDAHGVAGSHDGFAGHPTYSLSSPKIPSGDVAVPASSKYARHIHKIEMAELQIFPNVLLDTGATSNRRLFIDEDGKPVTKKKQVDAALGLPSVRLHRSSAWKKGKNTGTSGDFTPTGDIERYKPDPSLYGPQSPK